MSHFFLLHVPAFVPVVLGLARSTKVAIIAVVVGMAFFWALYFAVMVKKRRDLAVATKAKAAATPKRALFDDLCQSHALTHSEQSLLRELSKTLGLSSPTLLLVEPKHLQDRSQQPSKDAELAATLLNKLFGDLTSAHA